MSLLNHVFFAVPIWQWRIQNVVGFGLGGLVSQMPQQNRLEKFVASLALSGAWPTVCATLSTVIRILNAFVPLQFFVMAGLLLYIQMALARCCHAPETLLVARQGQSKADTEASNGSPARLPMDQHLLK